MQIQNSERFFVIGLSCIVDNGLCSALASSHCARNPYVRSLFKLVIYGGS